MGSDSSFAFGFDSWVLCLVLLFSELLGRLFVMFTVFLALPSNLSLEVTFFLLLDDDGVGVAYG